MTDSGRWYRRAQRVMPGGVNSPVRAFGRVGGDPPFIAAARGARLHTVDGHELIDFIASWGALILGHAHPVVVTAVQQAAASGTSVGVPTPSEVELAEAIVRLVPSIEVARMVNSGTEATAAAIRLARAATGRAAVIKFEGCYHGHADPFLVKAGSGPATFGEPDSPGVPAGTAADTLVARYNDPGSVEALVGRGEVAAVIVEPVAGNMGVVPPDPGFLEGLRSLCDRSGALLVFDEVMTGFRVALGGAQARFGVMPDLTCLGKVVAGGTPGAAYGGRADLMQLMSPEGPVYQAGTLAGNPLVVAAGLATLRYLEEHPDLYERLEVGGAQLQSRVEEALDRAGVPGVVQRVGAMFTVFFGVKEVHDWNDAASADGDRFGRFFHAAYRRGVLVAPSPFEAVFLMEAHLDGDLAQAGERLAEAIGELG
ncbi:MAG: glutamate-1-semialdehyde 2,1-aminomutase [Acidimicrobiia bacterium]